MGVITVFFGPCAPDILASCVSFLSYYFNKLDLFVKLATSSLGHLHEKWPRAKFESTSCDVIKQTLRCNQVATSMSAHCHCGARTASTYEQR